MEIKRTQIPLVTLSDLSLLLAILAIVFLIVAEFVPSSYGQDNLQISKKRLRNVAIIIGVLFLITVVIQMLELIL